MPMWTNVDAWSPPGCWSWRAGGLPVFNLYQYELTDDITYLLLFVFSGALDVVWVPFSVSQTSNQSTDPSAAVATCPAPSSRPLPQTSTTVDMDSPVAPVFIPSTSKLLSSQLTSSCSNATQSSALLTTPTSHTVQPLPPSTVKELFHLGGKVLLNNPIQPASTSVSVSLAPAPPCTLLKQRPTLALNLPAAPRQNLRTTVLLTNSPTVYQLFPIMLSQTAPSTVWLQKTCSSLQILPALASSQTSTCPYSTSKPLPHTGTTNDTNSPVLDKLLASPRNSWSSQLCLLPSSSITPPTSTGRPLPHTDGTSEAASPVPDKHLSISQQILDPERVFCDITSSPLKQQQSEVVRAVADSACDHSVQQVTARRQGPTKNEPTSTVSEETEPAGRPSEQPRSVIGHLDCSLSQWQPRVTLLRLPMTPPRPGSPLPGFSLVSDEDNEIYLKKISEDSEVGHHLWIHMTYILLDQPVLFCTHKLYYLFSVDKSFHSKSADEEQSS